MPAVDVERACVSAASAPSRMRPRQQFFYDRIRLVWDDLSLAGQRYCFEKLEDTRQRLPRDYYDALWGFVTIRLQAEQRARDRVATPRFQAW